jgi:hypothetical protein
MRSTELAHENRLASTGGGGVKQPIIVPGHFPLAGFEVTPEGIGSRRIESIELDNPDWCDCKYRPRVSRRSVGKALIHRNRLLNHLVLDEEIVCLKVFLTRIAKLTVGEDRNSEAKRSRYRSA